MISVIVKLDKSARARLSWIQSFAASFGIVPKPIYGHITLADLEGGGDAVAAVCRDALAGQGAFTVDFGSVAVLPEKRVIAALAAPEGALTAIRKKLVPGGEGWIPHTVLLRDDRMDLNWVRGAMAQMFEPFTARVERIEFMEGNEIIGGFALEGETV